MTRHVLIGVALAVFSVGEAPKSDSAKLIDALQPYQTFVGRWRGVGQPKRGSNKGAWQEKADVLWQLTGHDTGLVWKSADGPLWKSARFTPSDKPGHLALHVTLSDDTRRTYVGQPDGDKLTLETAPDGDADVHRLTITRLNENRVIWLFEQRTAQQSFFQRVAEIGFQREGTRLAAKDGSGPECVVTGGLGTIPVSYQGQTYYVCCTGCRDAFNDDPAGILAAWAERQTAQKK